MMRRNEKRNRDALLLLRGKNGRDERGRIVRVKRKE